MWDFLRGTRFKILLAVLVMLVAFMLRAAWTGGLSPLLAQAMGLVVTPLQKVSASISDSVSGLFLRYAQADQVAEENERLREEVNMLRERTIDFEQYKQENETLKQFLGIKEEHPDFEMEPASVIARDPHDRFGSFTIDKGTMNGVAVLDPVISPDGLVGRVYEVGLSYAKVITLLDVKSDVGAYNVRTREPGNVAGDVQLAAQGQCKLAYLPRESSAAAGDLIVTSGGGVYPKGLVIGELVRVSDEASGISLYGVINPSADIPNLTNVMVIKYYEGQEAAHEPES